MDPTPSKAFQVFLDLCGVKFDPRINIQIVTNRGGIVRVMQFDELFEIIDGQRAVLIDHHGVADSITDPHGKFFAGELFAQIRSVGMTPIGCSWIGGASFSQFREHLEKGNYGEDATIIVVSTERDTKPYSKSFIAHELGKKGCAVVGLVDDGREHIHTAGKLRGQLLPKEFRPILFETPTGKAVFTADEASIEWKKLVGQITSTVPIETSREPASKSARQRYQQRRQEQHQERQSKKKVDSGADGGAAGAGSSQL